MTLFVTYTQLKFNY